MPVDVRIVAATNVNLAAPCATRAFREDLYYRLNVVPIHVPPLRERREDIPALVEHFVRKYRARVQAATCAASRAGALEVLHALRLARQRARARERDPSRRSCWPAVRSSSLQDVPLDVAMPETGSRLARGHRATAARRVEQFERQYVLRVLERVRWNVSRAARLLGVHRNTVLAKLSGWGVQRPGSRRRTKI